MSIAVSEPAPSRAGWRSETLVPLLFLCSAVVLHLIGIRTMHYDSDETQHLHVAWGWTQGLLPYRDLFDNHTPLFQFLTAPLLQLVGERVEVVEWMRLAMLPFYLAQIAVVFILAQKYFRLPWWSAAIAAWAPVFFARTIEYRNDQAWSLATLVLLLLVVGGLTTKRAFVAGFVFGLATAVSMKTLMVGLSLSVALVIAALVQRRAVRPSGRLIVSCLGGALLLPAAVMLFFSKTVGWRTFYYCVVSFNSSYSPALHYRLVKGAVAILLAAIAIPLLHLYHRRGGAALKERFLLAVFAAVHIVLLVACWPILHPRDFLPIFPLLALIAVDLMTATGAMALRLLLGGMIAAEMLFSLSAPRFWSGSSEVKEVIAATLAVTAPGDVVFDAKGETVFRRRATYQVFETIARQKIARGELADDIVHSIIRRGCTVITRDAPLFTHANRDFVKENFLDAGAILIAGKKLTAGSAEPVPFYIEVPADYTLTDSAGEPVEGVIDGVTVTHCWLSRGRHELGPVGTGRRYLVWSRAIDRGFRFVSG